MRRLLPFALALAAASAHAQLAAVGPFAGSLSEGFESFPNYAQNPDFFLADPTPVFGGAAQLTGESNVIYQPGVADFFLVGNGDAAVHGGIKGMGVNDSLDRARFTFTGLVSRFGGYFAHSDQGDNNIQVRFLDAGGAQIGAVQTYTLAGGVLQWRGWSSAVGIRAVEVYGRFPAIDDLQATPVPEPLSLAALSLGAVLLRSRVRRSA